MQGLSGSGDSTYFNFRLGASREFSLTYSHSGSAFLKFFSNNRHIYLVRLLLSKIFTNNTQKEKTMKRTLLFLSLLLTTGMTSLAEASARINVTCSCAERHVTREDYWFTSVTIRTTRETYSADANRACVQKARDYFLDVNPDKVWAGSCRII